MNAGILAFTTFLDGDVVSDPIENVFWGEAPKTGEYQPLGMPVDPSLLLLCVKLAVVQVVRRL